MTEEGEGFHETHMRMTTYVEKPLRERMEKLKERGNQILRTARQQSLEAVPGGVPLKNPI